MKNTNDFLQKFGYNKVFTKNDMDTYFGYDTKRNLKTLIGKKIISQIKKGYYYIHSFGEEYILEHPYFFIKYIGDGKGIISHGTALTYYGLLEQFFNSIVLTVNKSLTYSKYLVAGNNYIITKTNYNTVFGIRKIYINNNLYFITDIERTILDSFSNPDLSRGYKEVAKAFYDAVNEGLIDFSKIINYLDNYKNKIKLSKTLGFFIDTFNLNVDKEIYKYLLSIGNNTNYVHLDSKTKGLGKGVYNVKWKLILNEFENFNSIIKY